MDDVVSFAAAGALPFPERPPPHAVERDVLGIAVRFESDSAALLDAVEAAYGGERTPSHAGHAGARVVLLLRSQRGRTPPAGPPSRLRGDEPAGAAADSAAPVAGGGRPDPADLAPSDAAVHVPPPGVRTEPGGRLLFAGIGAVARAELDRRAAVAGIAPELAAERAAFRELLDTLTLFLVTRLDRTPVHAAAVAAGAAALVLAGPSGAGKSTLAYAAMRAGLRVLGDDAVYLQNDPHVRIWTLGRPLHLAPNAVRWFPELAGRPVIRRSNGKPRIAVELATAGAPAVHPSPLVSAGLCLLERGAGPPGLERIGPDDAVAAMVRRLDPGFDAFRHVLGPQLRAVAERGAWRLRLPDDPRAAVPHLSTVLAGQDATP